VELAPNLFDCYYHSGKYDEDLRSGASGHLMRRFETLMESPFGRQDRFPLTVEVGSGAGGHLDFVRHSYDRYVETDIRDYRSDTACDPRRPFLFANAEALPFAEDSVDRIISTCLLHHVTNPLAALSQWRSAVRPGGVITIFLPCDPGLLWRLGRRVGPRRKAVKHGIDYDFLMALSHRNHVGSLVAVIDRVFANDTVRRSGFPIPFLDSWNLNLAFVYQITKVTDRDK
jgi:phosphatidylethanolamine/phosphatidyl-N-methylethanolamine N-methyltransferase